MTEGELLERIAQLLRRDIGPAIESEYARTQAFMAAVVLQKVGVQLALAARHAATETADLTALLADLRARLAEGAVPGAVRSAVDGLADARDSHALCRLIEALYAARGALGEERFAALLGRTRVMLRRSIDRRMAVAG